MANLLTPLNSGDYVRKQEDAFVGIKRLFEHRRAHLRRYRKPSAYAVFVRPCPMRERSARNYPKNQPLTVHRSGLKNCGSGSFQQGGWREPGRMESRTNLSIPRAIKRPWTASGRPLRISDSSARLSITQPIPRPGQNTTRGYGTAERTMTEPARTRFCIRGPERTFKFGAPDLRLDPTRPCQHRPHLRR